MTGPYYHRSIPVVRAIVGPCNHCGSLADTQIHHRDFDLANNEPSNLEPLCRACHRRLHANLRAAAGIERKRPGNGHHTSPNRRTMGISFTEDHLAKARLMAERRGITVSRLIQILVEEAQP